MADLLMEFGSEDAPRWRVLSDLAGLLYARFMQDGQEQDLVDAVSRCHEALSLRPPRSNASERVISLHHLSIYSKALFELRGRHIDLLKSIESSVAAEALAIEIDHPYLTWFHFCITRSEGSAGMQQDPDAALPPWKKEIMYPTTSAEARFNEAVALAWTAHDLGHFTDALRAYKTAFSVAERILVALYTPTLQHNFLTRDYVRILPCRAASCALELGNVEGAVELLEQGRGQIWGKIADYSLPLDMLVSKSEDLTDRFRPVCVSLELLSQAGSGILLDDLQRTEKRNTLIGEWNDLLGEIRKVDGLAGFLEPKSFIMLRAAASQGPVIMLNVDTARSDAIIVQDAKAPHLVPLPQDLARIVPQLALIVANVKGSSRRMIPSKDESQCLSAVAQKLWQYICGPVVVELRALGFEQKSHIWWCPTGALASLPIHASGPCKNAEKDLMDHFISSYTPSLLSLLRAQARRDEDIVRRQVQVLAVGQSNSLPQVSDELAYIQSIFSSAALVLDRADATPEAVEKNIHHYHVVHFACHGSLDIVNPLDSFLALHGSNLSLKNLAFNGGLFGGQLAFVAACDSAGTVTGSSTDEAITLAAAFQIRGFSSVIGTLWEMLDADGPPLARDFYRYLLPDGVENSDCLRLQPAQALHLAVTKMRERMVPRERWSTFIHIGL
ncbi:CHAT domain-containing protein [Mycena polygramma]|nr:CHAT domain-containing protein [Mycena polygramma]